MTPTPDVVAEIMKLVDEFGQECWFDADCTLKFCEDQGTKNVRSAIETRLRSALASPAAVNAEPAVSHPKSIDALAQKIRSIDGWHQLGAAALAEALCSLPAPAERDAVSTAPAESVRLTALEGLLYLLFADLGNMRRSFGEVGSRDVDVAAWNQRMTATRLAIHEVLNELDGATPPLQAPATPGSFEHLKLMMEHSAFGGALQLEDALANIDDFAAAQAAPVAQLSEPITREQIKTIFLRNGFTVKPGEVDLKEYVYKAAEQLLRFSADVRPAGPIRSAIAAPTTPNNSTPARRT